MRQVPSLGSWSTHGFACTGLKRARAARTHWAAATRAVRVSETRNGLRTLRSEQRTVECAAAARRAGSLRVAYGRVETARITPVVASTVTVSTTACSAGLLAAPHTESVFAPAASVVQIEGTSLAAVQPRLWLKLFFAVASSG